MNLTESIKHLMSEGKLEWTTTDEVTGAEEATLADGSKFALHNIMGTLSLMYVGKDGKGKRIDRAKVWPWRSLSAAGSNQNILGG